MTSILTKNPKYTVRLTTELNNIKTVYNVSYNDNYFMIHYNNFIIALYLGNNYPFNSPIIYVYFCKTNNWYAHSHIWNKNKIVNEKRLYIATKKTNMCFDNSIIHRWVPGMTILYLLEEITNVLAIRRRCMEMFMIKKIKHKYLISDLNLNQYL